MNRAHKKIILGPAAVLGFLAAILALDFGYVEFQGNFHPITPGEAYRSAQLGPDELVSFIDRYGIRSVVNLRGSHAGRPWYDQEIQLCRRRGILHYDVDMPAKEAPSDNGEEMIDVFTVAPRPVLIHCDSGADRSGLAAAVWKMVIDGAPKSVAGRQLSIRYGHMPFGPAQRLDEFLDKWAFPERWMAAFDREVFQQ